MSTISDQIILGDSSRIFETNAKEPAELKKIEEAIFLLNGVKSIVFDESKYPVEFKISTSSAVKVVDIEKAVISVGFHAIPKTILG